MPNKRLLAPDSINAAFYHLISRVVEKNKHFGVREKDRLVADMLRHAGFTMMRVVTYCMMSNHFHILVEAPVRPSDEEIAKLFPNDDALEGHLAATLGSKAVKQFAEVRKLAR